MPVLFSNNGGTTLSAGINSSATSIAVADGSVFPSLSGSNYFYVTFEDVGNTKREIVKVTARSGNTLTVVRGQDGTSGTAFVTSDKAELRLNAAALNDATFTGVYSDLTGKPVVGDGGLTTNDFTDADHTKLDGIEASATADQTASQIKAAYEAETNAFTDAQFTKLSGIETSATADQTAAEVRALVESATDSNAFTDADHTKLNAVEALADVTDTTNVVGALTAGTNIAIAADGTISSGTAELKFNSFTGDGSTVAFTLTSSPPEHSTLTYIDGVYQNKTAYSMSGNVLTFSAAPDNGAAIEVSAANIAPVQESTEFLINQFTGNGSTVAFTLSSSPVENQTAVYISGVYQSKSNYALSGPSLTFSTAPPNTAPIEVMVANTIVYSIGQPDDGTVTTVKIAANAVTSAKIDATVASKSYVDSLVAATNEVVEDTTPQLGGDLDLNSHNITGTGNVDGRDVGTDGTKLDTIETSADVTDATNVTAAGALMDSELTSIASVKALNQGVATGDSPTFVNVTATSLDISGNIDVDGVTNLDVVDIDGAVDMASTLAVGGVLTANAELNVNGTGTVAKFEATDGAAYIQIKDDDGTSGFIGVDAGIMKFQTPGSSFSNKLTIGSSGDFNFSSGGVINESGSSADFRVESDGNPHMLFVDGGNNRVGIGDTSPAATLTVKATTNTYAGGLRIEGVDETTALGITHVNGDNYFSGNATDDHLVLTGSGNVSIPTGSLTVADSNTGLVGDFTNTSTSGYGIRATTYGTGAQYGLAVDSYGGGYSRDFTVGADGNVNVLTGNLVIGTAGKGIDFSANGNAGGMTSEVLDDYEEGTWTPTISGGTTSTTFSGRYTKIGRMVYANFYSGGFAITNASGSATIQGLPFTVKSTGDGYGATATFTHVTCFSSAIQTGYCNAGGNIVYPTPAQSAATTAFINSSLVYVMMSVAYEAA